MRRRTAGDPIGLQEDGAEDEGRAQGRLDVVEIRPGERPSPRWPGQRRAYHRLVAGVRRPRRKEAKARRAWPAPGRTAGAAGDRRGGRPRHLAPGGSLEVAARGQIAGVKGAISRGKTARGSRRRHGRSRPAPRGRRATGAAPAGRAGTTQASTARRWPPPQGEGPGDEERDHQGEEGVQPHILFTEAATRRQSRPRPTTPRRSRGAKLSRLPRHGP